MTQGQEVYGDAASYAEHSQGERITYLEEGIERTGTIVYVCAPGSIAGRHVPTTYIVECDYRPGWPDMVYAGDIIERLSTD